MLRISQVNAADSIPTLKVEGRLLGPWVTELARACEAMEGRLGCLNLDLSAVTYVDISGVELLCALRRRGVTLAACSSLVAELLRAEDR